MNRLRSFCGSDHGRDATIPATIAVTAAIAAMAAPTQTMAAAIAVAVAVVSAVAVASAVAVGLVLPCHKARRAPQPGTAEEAPMFERSEFGRRAVPGEERRAPMGAAHRRASGTMVLVAFAKTKVTRAPARKLLLLLADINAGTRQKVETS